MRINEYMKQYSVKIECSFGKQGSGTIIKVNDEEYYLATALHNFTMREGDESWRDVHPPALNEKFNEIKVTRNDEVVCSIVAVKDYYRDLIIFEIDNFYKLSDLAPTTILYDKFSSNINYFFHGYSAESGAGVEPNLHTRDDIEDYIYTIQSDQSKRINHLRGYSGSGVFIEYRMKFYLVGIVLERNDSSSTFYIFNLPEKLNDWSRKRNSIPLEKDVFDVDSSPTMYTIMIRRNKDTFLSKKARRLFGVNHKYKDLLQNPTKLEQLSTYIDKRNDLVELEEKYFRELADLYLLKTFIANKQGKGKDAEKYFEKAKFFKPSYIRYTNEVKEVDSREELLNKGKLAYMSEKYEEAKKSFKGVFSLDNIDGSDKIWVYEKLVDINKFEKNNTELIEAYTSLLDLYPKEEKLKRVRVYYELSKLCENSKKPDLLKKGLDSIEFENSDNFLEMKYKILKSKEKISERENMSYETRTVLEKLAYIKTEYMDELSQIMKKEEEQRLFTEIINKKNDEVIEEKTYFNSTLQRIFKVSSIALFLVIIMYLLLDYKDII